MAEHHEELVKAEARIALAYCTSWKPDVDGRVTIGKCKLASQLDRELHTYDVVILLSRSFFDDPLVDVRTRRAVLDHELEHAAVKYDHRGEPARDPRGRVLLRIRKHDLEEHSVIVARHGCYKRDIEHFASALNHGRQKSPDYWIGIDRLRGLLADVGLTVSGDAIAMWTQKERTEAEEWARLRKELAEVEALVSPIDPPPHVVAGVRESDAETVTS